jgi:hypothetical protein
MFSTVLRNSFCGVGSPAYEISEGRNARLVTPSGSGSIHRTQTRRMNATATDLPLHFRKRQIGVSASNSRAWAVGLL